MTHSLDRDTRVQLEGLLRLHFLALLHIDEDSIVFYRKLVMRVYGFEELRCYYTHPEDC